MEHVFAPPRLPALPAKVTWRAEALLPAHPLRVRVIFEQSATPNGGSCGIEVQNLPVVALSVECLNVARAHQVEASAAISEKPGAELGKPLGSHITQEPGETGGGGQLRLAGRAGDNRSPTMVFIVEATKPPERLGRGEEGHKEDDGIDNRGAQPSPNPIMGWYLADDP